MRKTFDRRLKRVAGAGRAGAYVVNGPAGLLQVIVSDRRGWEHVSVTYRKKKRIPTWEDMCFVKDLFWEKSEWVVQYHPPGVDYVNNHEYVLHLWRPVGITLPVPPKEMV